MERMNSNTLFNENINILHNIRDKSYNVISQLNILITLMKDFYMRKNIKNDNIKDIKSQMNKLTKLLVTTKEKLNKPKISQQTKAQIYTELQYIIETLFKLTSKMN